MTLSPVRVLVSVTTAVALAATLTSGASSATKKAKSPTVRAVTPLKLKVGERLTIFGSGFIPGRRTNTVVFKRDGKRAIFVKADRATSTKLTVMVPDRLVPFLQAKGGAQRATTFRVRVLARRLARRFTPLTASPRIAPADPVATGDAVAGTPAAPVTPPPPPDCDGDGRPDDVDLDDDDDLVSDSQEAFWRTDRCKKDTDGDGRWDHWETQSALDLNGSVNFPPRKTPWPNPNFAEDPGYDFDQDGLLQEEEHQLWQHAGRPVELNYSDGDQSTTSSFDGDDGDFYNEVDDTPAEHELDHDQNDIITDDEKDYDGDGIGNWDESSGRLAGAWWAAAFEEEAPFFGKANMRMTDAAALKGIEGVDPMMIDPDIDGDGVLDGDDDQDQDGWTNLQELHRGVDPAGHSGATEDVDGDGDQDQLVTNPFNPCLPDAGSRTCTLHPPFKGGWTPFDESTDFDIVRLPALGSNQDSRERRFVVWAYNPTIP